MTTLKFLGVAAAIGALAAPVAAQTPYPEQYPQTYPQQYPQTYPQQYPQQYPQAYPQQYPQTYPPGYGYPNQNYGTNVVQQVIDQLLGSRYNETDRSAVSRCASAALAEAQRQYPYGAYGGYAQPYAYGQGTYPAARLRVTAITDVQRRSSGLRVRGLIDSGGYGSAYDSSSGSQPYGDTRSGDLTFRCDVDYRGYVRNVRIGRNDAYRRY